MAFFGFGKDDDTEVLSDLVLAYLEEAIRMRVAMVLKGPRGVEWPGQLLSIEEAQKRMNFRLQKPMAGALDAGAKVELVFIMENVRIIAKAKVRDAKSPQSIVLSIPSGLELGERRKSPRARLNQREAVTVTALTGLFEGIGITGTLEALSESGMQMRISKAMLLPQEKNLAVTPALFKPGHKFMLIKITKLPKSPPLEVMGTLCSIFEEDKRGVMAGIAFADLKSEALGSIKSFVSSRATPTPKDVPPKLRRSQMANNIITSQESGLDPQQSLDREPGRSEKASPESGKSNLRGFGALLAMYKGPEEASLINYLIKEGFRPVKSVHTLTELLDSLDSGSFGLLFLDPGVVELQGLDLAKFIRQREGSRAPVIWMATEELSTTVRLASRGAGIAQIFQKPINCDENFQKLLNALPAPKPKEEEVPPPPTGRKAMTMLIAMQESEERRQLAAFLKDEGYGQIVTASAVDELMGALADDFQGALFLDSGIQEFPGLKLALFLRTILPDHDRAPIVLLADHPEAYASEELDQAGVSLALLKPLKLDRRLSLLLSMNLGLQD